MAKDDLYTEHADTIESVLASVRRVHRLPADIGDEFSSWARLHLLEDDCAILRKFAGLSSLRTYLITVIQRLFLDWSIKEWGKWRPTTEARRLGPVAIELERLVQRDDIEYDQAVDTLISRGTASSPAECDRVWAELPRRPGRQRAGEDALDRLGRSPNPADPIEVEEQQSSAHRARDAMADALPDLTPQEQLIIRLRFMDGFTVARIARLIGEEQKPLYRRIDQILNRLRAAMLAAGVTADGIRDLLGNPTVEIGDVFPATRAGNPEIGSSTASNARGNA